MPSGHYDRSKAMPRGLLKYRTLNSEEVIELLRIQEDIKARLKAAARREQAKRLIRKMIDKRGLTKSDVMAIARDMTAKLDNKAVKTRRRPKGAAARKRARISKEKEQGK